MPENHEEVIDAIVMGAGVNGLYLLHRLKELGLSVTTLEAGGGVGGTWYWNRYPGARLDSESYSYGYFFSDELQDEWSWSEEFAGQPELERYFNFVVDRLDLRRHIQLNTRVTQARFDEASDVWHVEAQDGRTFTSRLLFGALGILSAPQFPPVEGFDTFEGECYHTGLWPDHDVEFAGKRVAVIGTGASGVQVIQTVAGEVESLTVFQRTPNWCTPINNSPITAERAREIRSRRDEIYAACQVSPAGFMQRPRDESALAVSDDERRRYLEELWAAPGLSMYQSNYRDLLTDWNANKTVTDFIAEKVRSRVHDSAVADKLIPKDHGFAMKRPPLETGYYEAFNRPSVELINLEDEPIKRIEPHGIRTSTGFYPVDLIVVATGFDSVTGSMKRIDVRGRAGRHLTDHWADGPRTVLGVMVAGFPNLFTIAGAHGSAGNNPRSAEHQVNWVVEVVRQMRANRDNVIEVSPDAEDQWTDYATSTVVGTLQENAKSWYFGSNTPGKKRAFLLFAGSQLTYRARLAEVASSGYPGFLFGPTSRDLSPRLREVVG